jgi:hypothetical protein
MKKTIITIIQVFVTLGILFWIFHDKQKREAMWNKLQNANLLWILAGVAAYGIVEILGATRWQLLLRVQGIYVPWYRLGSLLMIGIFFNQFMPGGTGGDVVKIFYLLKETPNKKTQALLAVLMDRLIGLIGLIFVAGVVIIWNWSWLTQGKPIPHFECSWLISYGKMKLWLAQIPATTQLLYTLLAILAVTVLGLIASFAITGLGLAHKLPARFPKRDIFVDLSIAYNLYARAWKASLFTILISFAVHIFSFLMFYSAARSLGMIIPVFEFFAIMPIINTLASLPISVGGAGVREGLFQTMLTTLCTNVNTAEAVGVSLLGASMVLSWGLVGGIIYLFYRPSEHEKLRDIEQQVEKLEHEIAESD